MYFTSFVRWTEQINILVAMLSCLQGAFGEIIPTWIPSWQSLATRNWWFRFACELVGHVCQEKLWTPPKCDPQPSTAEYTKEYPEVKTSSEPTSNRHLLVFFRSSIFRVYFSLGMALILKLRAVRSLGQEVVFLFRWLFSGVLQGWQRNMANFSISPKQIHSIRFPDWSGQYILQNSHSKIFRYDTCHRRTLLQHDFLSIFISVFLSKLHKKHQIILTPPWNQQTSRHHCHTPFCKVTGVSQATGSLHTF